MVIIKRFVYFRLYDRSPFVYFFSYRVLVITGKNLDVANFVYVKPNMYLASDLSMPPGSLAVGGEGQSPGQESRLRGQRSTSNAHSRTKWLVVFLTAFKTSRANAR